MSQYCLAAYLHFAEWGGGEGVLSWLKFLIVSFGVHNERGAPPLWGDAGRFNGLNLQSKPCQNGTSMN
jgi:hypothetical protein